MNIREVDFHKSKQSVLDALAAIGADKVCEILADYCELQAPYEYHSVRFAPNGLEQANLKLHEAAQWIRWTPK